MPKHKSGFSNEEHRRASRILHDATKLLVEIANAYGVSSRQGKAADRARRSLGTLRSAMDDAVFAEEPEKSTPELARMYYGPSSD